MSDTYIRDGDSGYGSIPVDATLQQKSSRPALSSQPAYNDDLTQNNFFQNPSPFEIPTENNGNNDDAVDQTVPPSTIPRTDVGRQYSETKPVVVCSYTPRCKESIYPWDRCHRQFKAVQKQLKALGTKGVEVRRSKKHMKYLRDQKKRDSGEKAKAVDEEVKQQITAHRERDQRINSEAKRKAKEQKLETRAKERRAKDGKKRFSLYEKKVEREEAEAAGATKTQLLVLTMRHKVTNLL